jgi:hypothetical protein
VLFRLLLTDSNYLINSTKKFKELCKLNFDDAPTITKYEDVEKFADYYKLNYIIYNSCYIVKHCSNNAAYSTSTPIEIMIDLGHAKLLLNKKLIVADVCESYTIDKSIRTKNHFSRYPEKKVDKTNNINFITWDIETYTEPTSGTTYTYLIALHGEHVSEQFYCDPAQCAGGRTCFNLFYNYLKNRNLNNYTFYSHNGAKYDTRFLIQYLLHASGDEQPVIDTKKTIEVEGKYYNLTIKINNNTIHFKDTYLLMPTSLKSLCQNFCISTEDSKLDIDKEILTDYNKIIENFELLKKYNKNDVVSLYLILKKFSDIIYNRFKLDITKSNTLASLARKIVKTTEFYPVRAVGIINANSANGVFNLLKNLPTHVEDFIKKSYLGGRTECFKLGVFKNTINVYDINSSYPYQGTKK